MALKFTEEQQKIIDSRNHNILVSASAGSGKTTVMIKRIIELVLDKVNPVPIKNFLVVTFTKASAADMKKKLIDALTEQEKTDYVLEQIDDVSTSDISNLHSFCSRLISTYFYEVDIDPAYQVLDDINGKFLQNKALDKLFEQKEKTGDENYFKLFDIFQKKRNNDGLKKIIMSFNNYLNSNLDSKSWFEQTFNDAYNLDLNQNVCARLINNYVSNQILKLSKEIEEFAGVCLNNSVQNMYDYFMNISLLIRSVKFSNSYMINAKNIFDLYKNLPKAPSVPATCLIKKQIDAFKAYVKKQLENFKKNFISDDENLIENGISQTREYVKSLYDLVVEFNEIYSNYKKEINSLDFNDLEKYALKILSNNEILSAVKAKYKYVFVDEYQDINAVQEKIISLVSGTNNRFMVGDIKQSIYRFRLCDPDIFIEKYNLYGKEDGVNELHKLNCNFRSDKKILKFVDEVFSGVMTKDFGDIDYEKDSTFMPGEDNLDNEGSVNLWFIDTTKTKKEIEKASGVYSVKNHIQPEILDEEKAVAEARLVADRITKLLLENKELSYSDFAVLVGSRNVMVSNFIENLKSYGIPVSSDEKFNLFEKDYIKEILNFAKLSCNFNDDYCLFKVLKSRFLNFTDDDLVEIRKLDLKTNFYDCVNNYEQLQDENLKNKLEILKKDLMIFKELAGVLTIKQLCKKIIEYFNLTEINLAGENAENSIVYLNRFIVALPETDAFDFFANYESYSFEVENECGGNTVSVMTIHKSKGIEFKYVFLINTTNEFNFESTFESVVFNKQYGVGIDYFNQKDRTQIESVASSAIKLLEKRKLVEEQQRVLYVALTRAKEKLFVVCSKDKDKIEETGKFHKKCYSDWFEPMIYNELYKKHNPIINFESYSIGSLCEKNKAEIKTLEFKEMEEQEPKWFEYKYANSVDLPLKNSISKILKVQKKELENTEFSSVSSAERGTVYHKLFENIDFKKGDFAGQLKDILNTFDDEKKQFIDENKVLKILAKPIFNDILSAENILQEREFYAKVSGKIIDKNNTDEFLMQGIIDLVAIFENGIYIVDYKTGKINDEKIKDYSFQIEVYSNIAERIFGKKVLKKIICLIDEEKIIEI